MMFIIMLLAALGLAVSIYTYMIEMRMKQDPTYKPVCDLSDRISCSKPMQSVYRNLFFVSDAMVGIGFYAAMIILSLFGTKTLIIAGAALSCGASCILAYLLYFKVQAFCLLCTALYIINFLMLLACIKIL